MKCGKCGTLCSDDAVKCKKCGSVFRIKQTWQDPNDRIVWAGIVIYFLMFIDVFLPYKQAEVFDTKISQMFIKTETGGIFLCLALIGITFSLLKKESVLTVLGVVICVFASWQIIDVIISIRESEYTDSLSVGIGFIGMIITSTMSAAITPINKIVNNKLFKGV